MRWVLTYKDTGAAKGRIVLVGYEDPDLEEIVGLANCACNLPALEVGAPSLQGGAVEEKQDLFAAPVDSHKAVQCKW